MSKLQVPDFVLSDQPTNEQLCYFKAQGFIVFRNFISTDKVQLFLNEAGRVERELLAEGKEKVNGVPLKFGIDDQGNKMIQRLCFLSLFSDPLHEFLQDPRLQLLNQFLLPYEGRISENEKDGLIMNNYIRSPKSSFSKMGWHTDCPRDLFLGQKIMPMLNVGIHLDDCPFENGGLRVLPGTHKQGLFKLLFRKKYFVDNEIDPNEVGFDMKAGDLSLHDGRLWHRAQSSPYTGEKSRRRVLYVPLITGKHMPKNEKSSTPIYHRFAARIQN